MTDEPDECPMCGLGMMVFDDGTRLCPECDTVGKHAAKEQRERLADLKP